jgi:hypothetical protein
MKAFAAQASGVCAVWQAASRVWVSGPGCGRPREVRGVLGGVSNNAILVGDDKRWHGAGLRSKESRWVARQDR